MSHPIASPAAMANRSPSTATSAPCRAPSACADCVVTFICSREPGEAVVVDVAEERAMRLLSGAGLLPELRHVRRTG